MSEEMQLELEHTLKTMRELKEAKAEIKRLRAALEFYADRSFDGYETFVENYGMTVRGGAIIEDAGAIARAALAEEKKG